ncbi:MAG: UpxY family transcription antiterminator [Bacteroidaceae bacterium]|nr:UpxY family transcription antiterminator [Bacteroidaceae bacterium]
MKTWWVLKAPYSSLKVRDYLLKEKEITGDDLDYFLPTYFIMQQHASGQKIRVEKSLMFNYVFVRCTRSQLDVFLHRYDFAVRPVYRRKEEGQVQPDVLSVPDAQMDMFVRTVGHYDGQVPYLRPQEADLQEGDVVRIIGGPFDGVEGTLITRQGKDGGRVLVNISDVIAVPTLEIEPEFIQILRFAKAGRHMYKKFQAYTPRIRAALVAWLTSAPAFAARKVERATIRQFIGRYDQLQTDTVNAKARHLILMMASHVVLEEPAPCIEELTQLLPSIKSSVMLAMAHTWLYACTSQTAHRDAARREITSWATIRSTEQQKREVSDDLNLFDNLIQK